jgi:hypothetical protein
MTRLRRKLSFDVGTAVIRTAVAAKSRGDLGNRQSTSRERL